MKKKCTIIIEEQKNTKKQEYGLVRITVDLC